MKGHGPKEVSTRNNLADEIDDRDDSLASRMARNHIGLQLAFPFLFLLIEANKMPVRVFFPEGEMAFNK